MQLPRRPYLTERAHHVLELAHGIADGRGDPDITPAHVVLGFLEEGQNIAVHVLHKRGVPLDALAGELTAALPPAGTPRATPADRSWTPADEAFAASAMREARELDTAHHGVEHLLVAMLRDREGEVAQVLARYGVTFEEARDEVRRVLGMEAA